MDNQLDTWTNFNNQYWPAHYLINKKGQVVYTHLGEGQYQETENNIRTLLGLGNKHVSEVGDIDFNQAQTPETYLGYARMQAFGSPETIAFDHMQHYTFPAFLPANHWALSGQCSVQGQRIVSEEAHAKLELNFTAKHVYLVLGNSTEVPIIISLKLNGKAIERSSAKDVRGGRVSVEGHRLYELIDQNAITNGLLEIEILQPGLEAYAFTFG